MARVKTFINGGSILPGDVNLIQDDYEFAFGTYKDVVRRSGVGAPGGAGTLLLAPESPGTITSIAVPGSSTTGGWAFYIDPSDYTANARSNKYRLRVGCVVNAVAPGITFTFGLYPVSTWGGVSGSSPTIATLGAVVAGSAVPVASPGAAAATPAASSDFTAPVAGWYALAVANPGGSAINSIIAFFSTLQRRQV